MLTDIIKYLRYLAEPLLAWLGELPMVFGGTLLFTLVFLCVLAIKRAVIH